MSQEIVGRSDSDHLLEECLVEMNYLLRELRSTIGYPDTAGRQRVLLDAISASLTLATITTVGTVTTVTTLATLTNQAQVGGLLANGDQVAQWNNIAGWNRSYIDVQP